MVSDSGEVKSLKRTIPDKKLGTKTISERILKQSVAKTHGSDNGYLVVNIHKNGKSNVIPVHRLVAEAFIPNDNGLPTVNHIDGNKQNNSVENLEWASFSDNNKHALTHKLRKARGVDIIQFSGEGKKIGYFKSVCEASRITGINRSMISHCVNHRAKSAGGYMWKKVCKCNDYLDNESTADDEFPPEAQERDLPKI